MSAREVFDYVIIEPGSASCVLADCLTRDGDARVLLLEEGPVDHPLPVVAHLPGFGRNLQDHLEIYVQHVCTKPTSLYAAQRPWNRARIRGRHESGCRGMSG